MNEFSFKYPGEMFTFEVIVKAEDETEALKLKNAGIKLCEDIGLDAYLALKKKNMQTRIRMRNQIFDAVLFDEFKQAKLLQKNNVEYSMYDRTGHLGDDVFVLILENKFPPYNRVNFSLTEEECLNPTKTKQEIQSLVKQIQDFDYESYCHAFEKIRDRSITLLLENNYKSHDEEFEDLIDDIIIEECEQFREFKFRSAPDFADDTYDVLELIDDFHANPENKLTILAEIKKKIPAHEPILQKIEDHFNKSKSVQKQNNSSDTLNNNNSTSEPKAYVESNSSKTDTAHRHPANDKTKPSEKKNSSAAKAEFKRNSSTNNPFSTFFKLWMVGLVVGSGLAMSGLFPIGAVATQTLLGTTLASFGIGICARLYQRLSSQASLSNETATSKMSGGKDANDDDNNLIKQLSSPSPHPLVFSNGPQTTSPAANKESTAPIEPLTRENKRGMKQ